MDISGPVPSVAKSGSRQPSVVQLYGEYCGESCGYCKDGCSASFGMKSERMNNEDYEALMYRGFRRCGDFYYKPVMHKSCCPQYAIRLHAESFKPSKSQRNCARKFEAHLERGQAFEVQRRAEQGGTGSVPAASSGTAISYLGRNVLTIETRPAECTEEVFQLYKAYQMSVHGDKAEDLSKEKFSDFLVMSSLPLQPPMEDSGVDHPMGTHHQLYRIDGRLVAVGVLDFLPTSLSSVYCFYDPSLKHLALGKYTALREIQYCAEINVPYYCMGFYIHSCSKMNYKGDYSPSELLCPTTLRFFPLAEIRLALDAYKFTPFEPELIATRADIGDELYFTSSSEKKGSKTNVGDAEEEGLSPAEKAAKDEHAARMAGMFGPRCKVPIDIDTCALVVTNIPDDLRLSQLKNNFQKMFRPLLTEWVTYAGPEVAARVKVKLG